LSLPVQPLPSAWADLSLSALQYLIYRPASNANLTVTLPAGKFSVTWFDINSGREVPAEPVRNVGSQYGFISPVDGDAVLYLNANSH